MSKITVTTIAGATSGADANKVKIESGDTLESSTIGTASGAMSIKPAGTEVVNIGTTGDILVKGATNQRAALLLRAGSNTANSQIQLGDQSSDSSGRIMYDHSDDTMRFNTNGSERFRVSASGIHIGGTGAANALDDYEEGTWTPTIVSGGTVSGGGGYYRKIGSLVIAWVSYSVASISGSGVFTIGGLPFTASGNFGSQGAVRNQGINSSQGNVIVVEPLGSTTNARFHYPSSTSVQYTVQVSNVTVGDFNAWSLAYSVA